MKHQEVTALIVYTARRIIGKALPKEEIVTVHPHDNAGHLLRRKTSFL